MGDLKDKTIKGLFWGGIDIFSSKGLSFIFNLLIARQLSPRDYGVIAILAVMMAICQCFVDSGFGAALVRKCKCSETDFSTIFYFNIFAALLFYIILYAVAPFIASFYEQPVFVDLTKIYSLVLIINALAIVQNSKLTIEVNFKVFAKISIISAIISGSAALFMAYKGFGIWSLVVQALTSATVRSLLLWVFSRWTPKAFFSWNSLNEHFSFGSRLLGSSLINTIYNNPVVVVNVNTPGTVSFLDFAIPAKGTDWSEADDIAVYKNGVADLNKAGCSIRLRGNTSSNYDKRPMAIKLNKKAGILGMKEHKRWILLSPWTDMSLIRNYLAFNIAQTIQNHFINGPTDGSTLGKGLVWNPSGQNVELVINGIHAGNYLFCEQIKINKSRLNMTNPIFEDVVTTNTSPTVKDCSYLIEFDNNYDETWKFKTPMRELPCLFKDDFKVTAKNGTTYDGSAIFESLKTYINAIESNLTNGYYTEAYKSLDINSVIDYWFVYEIAMNDEIQHPKSVYMYKDGDGKLCAGPVWDFDSQNFTNVDTEKNAYYYHTWSSLLIERAINNNENPRRYYMWWPLLMKDQNYINRVKARWADVYPDLIDVANRVVEERRAANRLSDEYNRKIWKVGNYLDEHWLCGDENMEFDDVMDNLKYCYNKRLENLNNTITNLRKW